ncbi:MAG: hypothetical protein JXA83_01030 [Acidimicrobiales bacterium]|nr:hypothetical protein [Acidimicrobiales bacterium]
MLKRTFWFTTGATAGFGGAMWIRRQVLRTVRRYTPEQVQAEVSTSVRRLGTDLREVVTEARRAMADREAELRSELAPGTGPAIGTGAPSAASTGEPPDRAHHAAVATGRPPRPEPAVPQGRAASRWRRSPTAGDTTHRRRNRTSPLG